MSVTTITAANLRTHELFTAELHPQTTLILGQNGAGKTSLLEALHLLHRGTSFRGRDHQIISHGKSASEMKITFDNNSSRRVRLSFSGDNKPTKQFVVVDNKSARLAPKHRLPVVLFEPDELRLLSSSPQRRRDFIDGVITRLSQTYSTVLSRYTRTLTQRNELLKQYERMQHEAWESHLFAWDVKLAELGASIIKARKNFLTHANDHLSRLYTNLAGAQHDVLASYSRHDTPTQQTLLKELQAGYQSDALRGNTSVGPHRDDMMMLLDGHPASETASRGEMRTIMLAFKLLEVELQEHHAGQKPLILLDDVFSELDVSREKALMAALKNYQTVITATDLRDDLKTNATIIAL